MKNRAVIIHDLAHAQAALSAAAEAGMTVTLMSAPGAAAYLGAAVFRKMVDAAAESCPGADFSTVLDCGDSAGLALAALRNGIKGIKIEGADEVKARIADIAAQTDAVLYEEEHTEALDLLEADDALEACRTWFANGESR